ncbi:MAG: hypothetical protein ACLQPD_04355 [Desulfomonilaceae bacterium]
MSKRTDDELREHPVFRELVKEIKSLPVDRQEQLVEEMESIAEQEEGEDTPLKRN